MGTPGSRLPPITLQYVYTIENHIVFMLQASDLAPLSSVYPPAEVISPTSYFSAWLLTCCSSAADHTENTLVGH